jgi:hypothetical protein
MSTDRRKKVVRVARRAAMGIASESIFGKTRKKMRKITPAPTPLLITRSVRLMILAIKRTKVKTMRLTRKAGMISVKMLELMMLKRILTSSAS